MSKVFLFLANGFEEIEALTPVDLLRRAGIGVETVSIAEAQLVTGRSGITVMADRLLSDIAFEEADMLVLPGGMPGTKHLAACRPLTDALEAFAKDPKKMIAAICAAPTVFGKLGLLNGKKACCYPGMEEGLSGAEVSYDRVVADGNIITSRGAGTAMDFALCIIARLTDAATAEKIRESVVG